MGPLVGGGLLEHFWWGSVFLINVPVMLVVAPVCNMFLPRKEITSPGTWTFGQALLLIAGMISLDYAIKAGMGGSQPLLIVLPILAFGVAMLWLFARLQLRSDDPMLDLSLFSHPAILAVAGLTLSIGLTASSIAIMGSVELEKGSAAGSLESAGYELGSGLGITLFGVFMAVVFSGAREAPSDLALPLAEQASRSIGDTYLVPSQLSVEQGAALIAAGKASFSAAHAALLHVAAAVIASLAIAVYFLLASYRPSESPAHRSDVNDLTAREVTATET